MAYVENLVRLLLPGGLGHYRGNHLRRSWQEIRSGQMQGVWNALQYGNGLFGYLWRIRYLNVIIISMSIAIL